MAVFEVIVLGVQGINNKVHGPGERVTEAHFPEGNALKLEKEGKLKRISGNKVDKENDKVAKKQLLAQLSKAIEEKQATFNSALEAYDKASDEEKEALKTAVDEAELALGIAKENFEKA